MTIPLTGQAPDRIAALFGQAMALHRGGQLARAEEIYKSILTANPDHFEALHFLGLIEAQRSRYEQAEALMRRSLKLNPHVAEAFANYARVLNALKRSQEALAACDKALSLNPRSLEALVSRGNACKDLGEYARALASYEQALAVRADYLPALTNCAAALTQFGRHLEALEWLDRSLAINPNHVESLLNQSSILRALFRPAEAAAYCQRALAVDPSNARAQAAYADALNDLGRFQEALASYDRAISLKPDFFDARSNRARVLSKLDRCSEAIAEYEALQTVKSETFNVLNDLYFCKATACDWSGLARLGAEVTARVIDGTVAVDPFLFVGLDTAAERQLACSRNWLRLRKVASVERKWNPADFSEDTIRVAYLSGDFRRHAVANVIGELFERHDRKRFEIVGVSFGPNDGSAIRTRLIKSFDRFIDATDRSDQDVARLLRDLKANIAVDLMGHTNYARMGILADRAAPIQVTYLGYPGTTGADFMDYILGDQTVLPRDQRAFFTERFVHLPNSYQVNDSTLLVGSRPSRADAGLPDDAFVFCCFNNPYKIGPTVFEIWMRLLKAVPGSVLWLFAPNRLTVTNLRREAQLQGVEPERLVFAPSLEIADHVTRQQIADLFLDTLPYNGHATASASLWAGVPVLTCLGKTFPGRVGASLLRAVGLPELVTENLADYEALGLRLARDAAMLAAVRAKLAQNRGTHPLFDTDRFCRHIEAAYLRMWEMFARGESPRDFSVEPITAPGRACPRL